MERLTKLAVAASVGCALWLFVDLAARAWPSLSWISGVTFLAGLVFALLAEEWAAAAVLASCYLVPISFLLLAGRFDFTYETIWLAALFGVILPRTLRSTWSFPRSWKVSLVLWALAVALSWPIVVAREMDFTRAVLDRHDLWSSSAGVPPMVAIAWILSVTCLTGLGLLWFDWLFAVFGQKPTEHLERRLVAPLLAIALVAVIVGALQAFIDPTLLNRTVFGATGRASGTLLDGNAFGMITALWLPMVAAFGVAALRVRAFARRAWVLLPVFVLFGIGVWASGSKTAFLAALIGMACLLAGAWRRGQVRASRIVAGVVLAGFFLGVGLVFLPQTTKGPIRRLAAIIPKSMSSSAVEHVAYTLWNRGGYGYAGLHMFQGYPLSGVGIGSFQVMVRDFSIRPGYVPVFRDNAQNWYRQELAEMGLLGSVGPFIWLALFVWGLVRHSGAPGSELRATAGKGALLGLAIVSLVGIPTENPAVLFTFWLLAFWTYKLVEKPSPERPARRRSAPRLLGWGVTGIVTAAFVGVTVYAASTSLRPPSRAATFGWSYAHGFYDLEHPTGRTPFWWTRQSAVAVFPADGPYVTLEFWVHHPDAAPRPVEVKIWDGDHLLVDRFLRDSRHVTEYLRVPDGQKEVLIRTWVSRTWRPSDAGGQDSRDLGLGIAQWRFPRLLPAGALIVH